MNTILTHVLKRQKYYRHDIRYFDFPTVDADTVMLMIKNLNSKRATGYDNIPGKLIKVANRELGNPLCNLMNHSMKLKCFPCIMKSAELTPVCKKENNLKRDNYRLVSIITAISKLSEDVLNTQMVNHFHALFNELLVAFRKSYSCQTLLMKFIMDLSKVFDCLPHGLLIAKIHAYGLSETACI